MTAPFDEAPDIAVGVRDAGILEVLEREGFTGFTFDGLKRLLGTHPETLSRALDRLEEQGLVQKTPGGYRVTPRLQEMPRMHPVASEAPAVPLVQTFLPYDVSVPTIIAHLKGRWFGTLRWLGYAEEEGGVTLKWVTDDGGIQIDAKFAGSALSVEARLGAGRLVNDAIRAAHQLVGYVARLYARSPPTKRMVAFTLFDPHQTLN
jgi:hypothetical protein